MGVRDRSQRCDLSDGEGDELRDVDFVCSAGFRIGDVGEPFQLGRNIREIAVLILRERPFAIDTK